MVAGMGIKGVKQKRRETPASLREYAKMLDDMAETLDGIAERMLIAGVREIDVRYSPGAHSALSETIRSFVADAEKKAVRAGARP